MDAVGAAGAGQSVSAVPARDGARPGGADQIVVQDRALQVHGRKARVEYLRPDRVIRRIVGRLAVLGPGHHEAAARQRAARRIPLRAGGVRIDEKFPTSFV